MNKKYWGEEAEKIIDGAKKKGESIVSHAMKKQEEILFKAQIEEKRIKDKIRIIEEKIAKKVKIGADLGEISRLREEIIENKKLLEDEKKTMEKAVIDWQTSESEYIKPFKIRGRGGYAWRNPNNKNYFLKN